MSTKPKNLGFTPIEKKDVFKTSPKLNDLFKMANSEVYFKTPENNFLDKLDNQSRFQGSVVMPDSKTCIDFEIISDFLMSDSSIALAVRDLLTSNQFGITEQDFKIFKQMDFNSVKEILKLTSIAAPKETSFKINKDINLAQKNIDSHTMTLNKKAKIQQNSNDYSPPRPSTSM